MLPPGPFTNAVLLRYQPLNGWLFFEQPVQVVSTSLPGEIPALLEQLDRAVERRGLYAAGFLSYEAAPGFDTALQAKTVQDFPLAWFGLYPAPRVLNECPLPHTPQYPEHLFPVWTPSVSEETYRAAIAAIRDYIERGHTYQVNYTYRLRTSFQDDPLAYFSHLARAQQAPYAAYVDTGHFSLCSASPELFFSLEGELLKSCPMKGTAARGLTSQQDAGQAEWLRQSEKNRAENIMIVDMVRNDIGRIARIGSVKVSALFSVEKYPTVWQMVSTVSGETKAGMGDIFQALFPAASITGAPKARTMAIIEELEDSPRRLYTGCIGFFSPGRRAQFNVAIRTVIVDKDQASAEYGVGGGITWDSLDSAEYEECQTKARVLSARIPRFSLLESLLWTPKEGYFLLDLHLKRLADSAAYFSFQLDPGQVCHHLQAIAETLPPRAHKVRLLVDENGQVDCQAEPLDQGEQTQPRRVGLAPGPVDITNPFLYHKTTNRLVYEAARAARPSFDDLILWNENEEATESCVANLVIELNGRLYTPPVSSGLLPGTYRAWLLERGLIQERVIRLEELFESPRVLLVNSVRRQQEVTIEHL